MMQTYTYILTDGKRFHCGKTNNLEYSMKEQSKGMVLAVIFEGDKEMEVKRAGIERIFRLCLPQNTTCETCGRKALSLRRDVVIEGYYRTLYYCINCDERWEVIENER